MSTIHIENGLIFGLYGVLLEVKPELCALNI